MPRLPIWSLPSGFLTKILYVLFIFILILTLPQISLTGLHMKHKHILTLEQVANHLKILHTYSIHLKCSPTYLVLSTEKSLCCLNNRERELQKSCALFLTLTTVNSARVKEQNTGFKQTVRRTSLTVTRI